MKYFFWFGVDAQTINVKTEDRKKVTSQEATLVSLERPWLRLSQNLDHQPPKKRTINPGDAFEDTAFKPGLEIVKF